MDKYTKMTVTCSNLELSSKIKDLALAEYKALGVEDFSIDEAKIDELLGERAFSGGNITEDLIAELETALRDDTKFVIYFSENSDAENFKKNLENKKYNIEIELDEKPTEDWNENWKKNYQTIKVNEDLYIIPSWEKNQNEIPRKNSLFIYPGRGFGTGTHETTFQCLKLFTDKFLNTKFKNCLDFGCGSGILGLNFIRLNKASTCVLYDIDEQALENCIQNIDENEFEKKSFHITDNKYDFKDKKFEVVFANILLAILIEEKFDIFNAIENNGYLIVSGLLEGQGAELLESYSKFNLKLLEHSVVNGWEAILFQKI